MLRNTKVVPGLGNLLLGDDGLGVWLVRALPERRLPPGTPVYEVGTELFSVPSLLGEHSRVLLVDAVTGERRPGRCIGWTIENSGNWRAGPAGRRLRSTISGSKASF
ncbi:MAG: hydrogenase maturation protease [Bacillota bacterium]